MEPPSPTLSAALRELRLASPRDLRRAATRCRAIARDLPAFDCVWIDALLGLRRITAFQAAALQDGEAERLRLGGYVLLDRLSRGCGGETFLARPLEGGAPCVVKVLDVPAERRESVYGLLRQVTEQARVIRSPHVIVPYDIFEEAGRIVLVSRSVGGCDARALLIRRGRLGGDAVAEIARQLLGGLAELHRARLAHGEVRLGNLRLTPRGDAVLVDAGVRPAVSPILPIDDARPAEWYDGTAPERVGTAVPATAAADVYALGCLLWHLLAGRPVFPAGDPLARLAAHRSRRVPDVREFAPDAPEELIRLVAEMTDSDPAVRPADCAELQNRLRRSVRPKRALIEVAGGARPRRAAFPWPAAAALLFALSGATVWLADRDAAATLLRTTLGAGQGTRSAAPSKPQAPSLAALPPPDASGVIALEHAGPFAAADVSFRGPLVLRGRADRPATVIVTDRPLHLWADEVTIEHVRVVYERPGGATGGVPALVLVEAQNLSVRSCRFECPIRPTAERAAAPSAVAWRLVDRADPTAGRVEVADCACRGAREFVYAADRPRRAAFENVLGMGLRSLLSLGSAGRDGAAVRLKNVTLRDAAAVVLSRDGSGGAEVGVTAEDSVLALGPGGSLVAGAGSPSAVNYRWSGSGVVTTLDVSDTGDGRASGSRVEGVTRAEVSFAGPADGSDAASVARVTGAPRVAGHVPGFDLSRLPREEFGLRAVR